MDGTIERDHNYPMTICPHCGREVPANTAAMHDSVCAFHPEKRANTLAAMTSDTPGVGKTLKDYERTYRPHRALSVTTLLRQYAPTWAGVLDAFGLETPPDARKRREPRTPGQQRMTKQQREEAAIADVASMEAGARRIMAAEYDNAHTLHGYAVRDLPGVTIGGRACVAVMLR